jgi:hypothetical protein
VDDAGRRRLGLGIGVVALALDDLDSARLELSTERAEVVLVEVVLGRERLEGELVEKADLLGIVEEGPGINFQQIAQFSSLLRGFSPGALRRRIVACYRGKRRGAAFDSTLQNVKTLQIHRISYTRGRPPVQAERRLCVNVVRRLR